LCYLDFLHEARNAERSREFLKHIPYVIIPKVHWNLTKKVSFSQINTFLKIESFIFQRILTYDFVDGITIDHVDELKQMNISLRDVSCYSIDFITCHKLISS
jgi:predicted unusual protein kinase regulating ubiquinone biosynthesis (AarF/ABC1/UbiB family)